MGVGTWNYWDQLELFVVLSQFLVQRTLNFHESHTLISPFARSDLVSRREHEQRPLNLSRGRVSLSQPAFTPNSFFCKLVSLESHPVRESASR